MPTRAENNAQLNLARGAGVSVAGRGAAVDGNSSTCVEWRAAMGEPVMAFALPGGAARHILPLPCPLSLQFPGTCLSVPLESWVLEGGC